MNNRLYVGNLPPAANEESLRALFSQKGNVTEVKLVLDPSTGLSRGTAFVTMATPEEAAAAIIAFHSYTIEKRNIAVTEARPIQQTVTGLISEGFEAGIGRFAPVSDSRGRRPQSNGRRNQGRRGGNGGNSRR